MTAVIDQISAAIAVDLDADPVTNFGFAFTTDQNGGDWDLPLTDQGAPGSEQLLTVDLVAVEDDMDIASLIAADGTKDILHKCTFQVIVRKRLTERIEDTGKLLFSAVQALTACVEKIATYFVGRELSTLAAASWAGSKVESIRYPATLRENSQFTGIARITYEMTERA